jgi:hypothetical protein
VLTLAFIAAGLPVFAQEGTATGMVTGTVVDTSGASIAHVQVKLSVEGRGTDQETKSAENGDFSFLNVAPRSVSTVIQCQRLCRKNDHG